MRHNCEFSKRFLFDDDNDNDDVDDNGDDRRGTRVLRGVAPPSFNRRDISTISQHLQKKHLQLLQPQLLQLPDVWTEKNGKKVDATFAASKKAERKKMRLHGVMKNQGIIGPETFSWVGCQGFESQSSERPSTAMLLYVADKQGSSCSTTCYRQVWASAF